MATYRRRGDSWRVEVCVKGMRASASFSTKREAQAWAIQEELKLREHASGAIPNLPFSKLLERYAREVSPTKRSGGRREQLMIGVISRDVIANVSLRDLTSRDVADWRDRRLSQVSGATVEREMNILSHACSIARREWKWLRNNPVSEVRRPPPTAARTRRPTEDETTALLHALGYSANEPPATVSARVGAAWLFACETGMRAGEICGMEWLHVNASHVHLPKTKNDYPRDVPLSKEAKRIIEQLRDVTGDSESVFAVTTPMLDALFRKAKKRALVEGLHFHDSRREALTRLAKIFDVMELARISGHRDLRILQNVYYAPAVADLAAKLSD